MADSKNLQISEKLVSTITEENNVTDLNKLESDLEALDPHGEPVLRCDYDVNFSSAWGH